MVDTPKGSVEGVEEVKFHIREHFERFFKEPSRSRPVLDFIVFKRLEVDTDVGLERPFTAKEIKYAFWNCDGCKTHGPDDFSFAFFKNHCEILKVDIQKFVEDFHEKAILTKACISSFIKLVSKVLNPQSFPKYRPICLVRSLHKIFSKLLASRLKEVIDSLIYVKQNDFIKNRNILGGFNG